MIIVELTRREQPSLKDIPKGLMSVREVNDFWHQVLEQNVSTRALRQIEEACKKQIALLRLRGPR